jgi:bifunctional DNA-binding transcriptional regulator/antitoxin component of YhaV-PrlF toxin-antitoxin module
VTSKFQVTVPRAIADEYGIKPGDEIDWVAAGDVIRVIPPERQTEESGTEARLRLFDQATKRIKDRKRRGGAPSSRRGWKREDLYTRGRAR